MEKMCASVLIFLGTTLQLKFLSILTVQKLIIDNRQQQN